MIPSFQVGPIYAKTVNSRAKIKVHEGGSSSSKTVSILQYLMVESFRENNALYTVTRSTVPNLKRGPIQDWTGLVLPGANATKAFKANKADHTWTNLQTGTRIEFVALDDEQKARGPRRNRLFMNEANEIPLSTAKQLMRRTSDETIIDYNPSLIHWWIDTEIIPRDDCELFHSTYKDNPFLTDDLTREIEEDVPVYEEADETRTKDWTLTYNGSGRLIKGDPYEWAVYGLGRRGSPSEAIYPLVEDGAFPDGEYIRGLDFGFEHPCVLLDVLRADAELPRCHIREMVFQSGLTNSDLIAKMDSMKLDKRVKIIADSSRPEAIQEIKRAGYNIVATKKGAGSVVEGIDFMKRHKLVFAPGSEQSKLQFQNYRRKKIAGIIQDEPVKRDDDAPDAGRYALFEHWGKPRTGLGAW